METLAYNRRDENEQFWFVMGSKNHMKELQIRDEARTKGLEAFVPITYAYKTIRGQKQRKLVPAINGYIFVKATTKELEQLIANSHYTIFPQKSTFTGRESFLTVSNHDMENFIAVIEKAGEHITYFKPDEISLNPGDKIRIQGGLYDGHEGIITRIKGKRNKHLVVQIQGILIAAVELKPEFVQLKEKRPDRVGDREKPSKNLDKDKKTVFDIAHRMLFEIPEKYKHEEEYYLLFNELKHAVARIQNFKGYTPATEAELALALYLAAKALGNAPLDTQQRLEAAVEKLKDSSKLKKTCLEYLEKFK
jgi:transcription antitermination factor NusG